ncbi:hypothetical protein BU15DRAFT_65183 [Melanogaster broomeanus]|nr:hypothetical protein BU15DRAFT_65183 [Melanogaster broomeanus]
MFIASLHQVKIFCKESERYGYVDSQQNAILKVASVALVRQQQSVVRHERTQATPKNLEVIIRNNPPSSSPICPRFDDELRQGKRHRFLNDFSVRWPFQSVYHSPAQEKSMGAREGVRKGFDSSADSLSSYDPRVKTGPGRSGYGKDRTSGKTEASVVCKSKDIRGAVAAPCGCFSTAERQNSHLRPYSLHQIGYIHQVSCPQVTLPWLVSRRQKEWGRCSGGKGDGRWKMEEGKPHIYTHLDGRTILVQCSWSVEKSIKMLGFEDWHLVAYLTALQDHTMQGVTTSISIRCSGGHAQQKKCAACPCRWMTAPTRHRDFV